MARPLGSAIRFFETIRHLKLRQITGRVQFRLMKPHVQAAPNGLTLRPISNHGEWVAPAMREASMLGAGHYCFLSEEAKLSDIGWDGPELPKLWRYNQHYFDDLNALRAQERAQWHRDLIDRWIADIQPGQTSGWEPYPISLRIVNWIKWFLSGQLIEQAWEESLAQQAQFLSKRLEHHLLGNHLFANAKALFFAGLWFEGASADRWRHIALDILTRELDAQFLQDGGQFELSPMYHALAFEDILDLINIARTYHDRLNDGERTFLARCEALALALWHWLSTMCHPDGELSFFNDSALGVSPSVEALEAYARRLGIARPLPIDGITWLPQSGYARLENGDAVILCDIAEIGPDYLPGHAHADTLSFECSLFGQRLFVNSGCSEYGLGEERLRQRGTLAHNTVTIASQNSSDVWSGFRVGARARILSQNTELDGEAMIADGSHDGYRKLKGGPIHHRRWRLAKHGLTIEDTVRPMLHNAEARYHLHPEVELIVTGENEGKFLLPDGQIVHWISKNGPVRQEESSWHPRFGVSIETRCLILPFSTDTAHLELDWNGAVSE